MATKAKPKVFKTFDEYTSFYKAEPKKAKFNGKNKSKYYRIGVEIAQTACAPAAQQTSENLNL